eukprot:908064-Prorocentrum_minimum.AAC.1
MVFVIHQKPHPTFAREGSDLIHNTRIPLVDALSGFKMDVKTLDNRILRVNIKDTVHPKYTK